MRMSRGSPKFVKVARVLDFVDAPVAVLEHETEENVARVAKFVKVARMSACVALCDTGVILRSLSFQSWPSTNTSQSILPTMPSGVSFSSLSIRAWRRLL